MEKVKSAFYVTASLFLLFILFTVAVMTFDVEAIGPDKTKVGLATMNEMFANHNGVNMVWYQITKILGILAILVAVLFGCLGLGQWIQKRSLAKVDADLFRLAGFYLVVLLVYVFFENFIVNYRPVILEEGLEASYPSSHTVLAVCILGSAMMQFHNRIRLLSLKKLIQAVLGGMMVVLVLGRLLSGVHWVSDIIGGVLLSISLLMAYATVELYCKERKAAR